MNRSKLFKIHAINCTSLNNVTFGTRYTWKTKLFICELHLNLGVRVCHQNFEGTVEIDVR